jgi:hypothetical protein
MASMMAMRASSSGLARPSLASPVQRRTSVVVMAAADEKKKRLPQPVKRAQQAVERRMVNKSRKSATATRVKKVRGRSGGERELSFVGAPSTRAMRGPFRAVQCGIGRIGLPAGLDGCICVNRSLFWREPAGGRRGEREREEGEEREGEGAALALSVPSLQLQARSSNPPEGRARCRSCPANQFRALAIGERSAGDVQREGPAIAVAAADDRSRPPPDNTQPPITKTNRPSRRPRP